MLLCAVYDSKSAAFSPPFTSRARGEAIRQFQMACQDDQVPFKKFPADFALFHLGDFDETSGRLVPLDVPSRLIGADEF